MLKNGTYGGLFAAPAALPSLADVVLPDTAWRDGGIVFDDADAGMSYRMEEARTAKGVDFGAAVSLSGETLTLTANSSIVVGEGVLEFSDSSAMVWTPGVLLSLTGDVRKLERGHVRFRRDESTSLSPGLSEDQLAALRYNGDQRVQIDDDGWLRSAPSGTLLVFR